MNEEIPAEELTLPNGLPDPMVGQWVNVEDSTPERYELVLGMFQYRAHDDRLVSWVRTVFIDERGKWSEVSAFGKAAVFVTGDAKDEEIDPEETVCVSNQCNYGDPVLWARFKYCDDGDISTTLLDTTKEQGGE